VIIIPFQVAQNSISIERDIAREGKGRNAGTYRAVGTAHKVEARMAIISETVSCLERDVR